MCILTPFMTGWVNRFANVGDIVKEVARNAASLFRHAKTEIVSASKTAYRFLLCVTNNVKADMYDSPREEESPRVQHAWLKKLITNGVKPSTSSSSEAENPCD